MEKTTLIEAHEPHWVSTWTWATFFTAFLVSEGVLVWVLSQDYYWVAIALVLVLGHLMHGHLIAFHEAAHGTLCPKPWVNDLMGVFVGVLGFMCFSLYRAAHHFHHAYLSTERDEELWPFVAPETSIWARRFAAFAELTFGLVFTPFLFLRTFLRKSSPIRDTKVRTRVWIELGLMAGFWIAVVAATAWFGVWKYLLWTYVIPAAIAGNMQSLRKYIEHMGLTGSTVLGCTRSVIPNGPLGKLIAFSLFNVSYHGVHHQYAKMPHSSLPEFSNLLQTSTQGEVPPYSSYREALRDTLASLWNPKVGAQWVGAELGQPRKGKISIGRKRFRSSELQRKETFSAS